MAPELLDYRSWPQVDERLLSDADAARYIRIAAAVRAACDGARQKDIQLNYGVSASLMHYYLARCTSTDHDGRVRGWRALIRFGACRAAYVRHTEPTSTHDGYGFAGAFERLLRETPTVKDWLNRRLTPDTGKKIQSAGLDISGIHQELLVKLRKAGCRSDQYPFTTKRQGYEALCAYVRERIVEGDNAVARMRYGDQAIEGEGRNSNEIGLLRSIISYERVAYDEYQLPQIDTITIVTGEDEIDVPLPRGYFCPIVDFKTTAVLGYSYSVSGAFRAIHLLKAFESAIHPLQRIQHPAFKELEPLPNEGLPASVIPAATGIRICNLIVDNHLAHLANSVVGHLRARSGVSISYGKVHSWIERYVVEGLFAEFQRRLRRIASTTGSGPEDPAVRDPAERAVRYKINAADIEALLDQLVARHNARSRRSLMTATPNDLIAKEWSEDFRLQIVPRYPALFVENPCIAIELECVTVRGSRKNGRHPYIQLDDVAYTNDLLKQCWSLIGTKLYAHIRGDYRTVRAFRPDGTEFGILHVSGVWAITPHTREVRKEINKLYRANVFTDRAVDPVMKYRQYLADIALQKNRRGRRPKVTGEAAKLAQSLSVQPGPNESPDYRYTRPPLSPPAPATAKSHRRHSFFVSRERSK